MLQEPVPEEDRHRENKPLTTLPRAFILQRDVDVTGVSGTGVVAWGVEFPDGVCALRWTSQWPTSVVFHDRGMEGVRAVHGHDGKTQVMYTDDIYKPKKEWKIMDEEFPIGAIIKDEKGFPKSIVGDDDEEIPPDGRLLLCAKYPKLYAVIGAEYCLGDESGAHFRVPDLRTTNIL